MSSKKLAIHLVLVLALLEIVLGYRLFSLKAIQEDNDIALGIIDKPISNPINNKIASLKERNSDTIGWIYIPDTMIDYPLMQSNDDPNFYLRHSFKKKPSNRGTIYLEANLSLEDDNVYIYGHSGDGHTMFSDLAYYKKQSFFKQHPIITITTCNETSKYQIISVFKDKVHYQDEKGIFRFYDYKGSLGPERFKEYVDQISSLSLYDIETDANYGDKLITLVTCSFHVKNGRLVIVAKKIDNEVFYSAGLNQECLK